MSSLEKEWLELSQRVIKTDNATSDEILDLKMLFFAGAEAYAICLFENGADGITAMKNEYNNLNKELDKFHQVYTKRSNRAKAKLN